MRSSDWAGIDQAILATMGEMVTIDDGQPLGDSAEIRAVIDQMYRGDLFGGRAGESRYSVRFAAADWPTAARGHRVTTAEGTVYTLDERGELSDAYHEHWWVR